MHICTLSLPPPLLTLFLSLSLSLSLSLLHTYTPPPASRAPLFPPQLVDVAQNQYPERLRRILMVNAPFAFKAAWKLISPWLDPVTRGKIAFVSKKEALEELGQQGVMDMAAIPVGLGGERPDDNIPTPNDLTGQEPNVPWDEI